MQHLKDLPMLIINDIDELNIENLKAQYESVSAKMNDQHMEKAKFSYWKDQISTAAEQLNG
jgi:hypothetical protein